MTSILWMLFASKSCITTKPKLLLCSHFPKNKWDGKCKRHVSGSEARRHFENRYGTIYKKCLIYLL